MIDNCTTLIKKLASAFAEASFFINFQLSIIASRKQHHPLKPLLGSSIQR
jgi:hypothetical protein